MDAFNYADHFVHRLAATHDAAPVQVEIHPGPHCDLYNCPHCYGGGQHPLRGQTISSAEIGAALDDVVKYDPTIVVSGITTEPLTHPDAAGILREIRKRNLRLGLYTKGHRLDRECAEALLVGDAECFVTISVDAVDRESYMAMHGLGGGGRDKMHLHGDQYFDLVLQNARRLRMARDERGKSNIEIRMAFLLFADNSSVHDVDRAVAMCGGVADKIRFAVPQYRNDGLPPGVLPDEPQRVLAKLKENFADDARVRILADTATATRSSTFKRCHVQRFQLVIDRTGNLFPCPQVAVSNYRHLAFGNLRTGALGQWLMSAERRSLYAQDVDSQMRCRICDRKDEAINMMLDRLDRAFEPVPD